MQGVTTALIYVILQFLLGLKLKLPNYYLILRKPNLYSTGFHLILWMNLQICVTVNNYGRSTKAVFTIS
jgi:hypothetical protein